MERVIRQSVRIRNQSRKEKLSRNVMGFVKIKHDTNQDLGGRHSATDRANEQLHTKINFFTPCSSSVG